jgi:hypothetical protein
MYTAPNRTETVILRGAGPYGGWYWYFKTNDEVMYGPYRIKALAEKDRDFCIHYITTP